MVEANPEHFHIPFVRPRSRTSLIPARLDGVAVAEGLEPNRLYQLRVPLLPPRTPPTLMLRDAGADPDELAICLVRGSEARAYPMSVLRRRHLVNDRIDERPCLVTFCAQCSTAAAYEPTIADRSLTFGVYGAYQGSMVMRDEPTGSLWAQFTGQAIAGPLAGTYLDPIPAHVTIIGRWLAAHPHSLTIEARARGAAFAPGTAPLAGGWKETVSHRDDRRPARSLVVGVFAGGAAKAYVLPKGASLTRLPPILSEDELGGVPIVLIGAEGMWPLAFDRTTPSGPVNLSLRGGAIVDPTGSEWDEGGLATTGPLGGTQLAFVPSHLSEWYAWAAHHPDTAVGELASR